MVGKPTYEELQKRVRELETAEAERRQAEGNLGDERAFLSAVFDNISEAIVTCDAQGRLVRFNEAARRLHGLPEQPIPPDQWTQHYDLYQVDGITPLPVEDIPLFRALQGERVQNAEIVVATRHDCPRYLVCNGQALIDGTGRISGAVIAMHDITDRKKAEEALRYSEKTFQKMLGVVPDTISIHSPQMDILYSNWSGFAAVPESKRILNTKCYRTYRDFDDICPDCRAKHVLSSRLPFQEEILLPDGMWVDLRVIPILDENNNVEMFMEWVRDISEQKRAEEEQKNLQAQLLQAQKMESVGTLAGGIAHNFNNILMGIQGRASLLMVGKNPAHPDYEHLNGIGEHVREAVELTRDLLGFAQGGKYEVKPTDLNSLIKHENKVFGHTRKEIYIHGRYEKNLWPAEVDQGQVKQVLLNLYVNAWQAMPNGGQIFVQSRNVTLDHKYVKPFEIEPGRYIKISVTDTGIGMNKAIQEKIFDPFFTTKVKGQGSGLGLASVYGIVKNHGGFINVYSEKGKGTTFNIYFPASEKDCTEEATEADQGEILYGQGSVLLVDDEEMVIDVGRKMLEKLGYHVLAARSGQEALALYASHKNEIDLVILDMIMPDLSGGETYDRMKTMDGNVRVLLSSGYSISGQAQEIMDRGCGGFIQKPFSLNELSIKIKEVSGQRPSGAEVKTFPAPD